MDLQPRAARRDISTARVAAHEALRARPVVLPPHLVVRPGVQPFLTDLLNERAPDDWDPLDLALAVQAAELTHALHTVWAGPLNPRDQVRVERLMRLQLRLLRGLRLIGSRRKLRVRATSPADRALLAD